MATNKQAAAYASEIMSLRAEVERLRAALRAPAENEHCHHASLHYFGRNSGVSCDHCAAMWTRGRIDGKSRLFRTGFGGEK